MKYLKAYIEMCEDYCEEDCRNCPMSYDKIHCDCHDYIIKNISKARDIIEEYINHTLEPLGHINGDIYRLKCSTCGHISIINKGKAFYDDYVGKMVYKCPKCHTLEPFVYSKKKGE